MKIEIRKIFSLIAIFVIVAHSTFAGFLDVKIDGTVLCVLYAVAVLFAFVSNVADFRYIYIKRFPLYLILWIAFLLFVAVSYRTNMMGSTRIFFGILLCVALRNRTNWIKPSMKIVAIITGTAVFFTLFFFAFPRYYSYVIDAYGFIPTGTSAGEAGYRAGISDHYSQNGIYISVCILTIAATLISSTTSDNGKTRRYKYTVIGVILAFVALLLTGKRGVLVFSLIAIIATYLIASKKKADKFVKLVVVLLVSVGLLQVLSETVPEIGYVFERFQSIGGDDSSIERLAMWDLAIEKFKQAPLLGNGLWSYRAFYKQELGVYFHPYEEKYQYLNAHNVYLQLLCETGIVGFAVYVVAVTMTLYKTIRNVKKIGNISDAEIKGALLFSICMQLFYIIYSFTGNCLYDIVFPFYAIAIAINMAIERSHLAEHELDYE